MTTHGPWEPTPLWLRWLGKPPYRRSVYASWMIGGGWDGWDYSTPVTAPVPAGYIDQPWRDSGWVAMSATDRACYEWPEDTALHRQCRAAYVAGATDYAASSPVSRPELGSGK